jgi:hypothetical protein
METKKSHLCVCVVNLLELSKFPFASQRGPREERIEKRYVSHTTLLSTMPTEKSNKM